MPQLKKFIRNIFGMLFGQFFNFYFAQLFITGAPLSLLKFELFYTNNNLVFAFEYLFK